MLAHKLKRCLSFMLVLVMLFSVMPVQAFAEEVHEHDVIDEGEGDAQVVVADLEGDEEPAQGTQVGSEEDTTDKTHEHSYTEETVAATCTEAGYTKYSCECTDSYTEEIAALGHDYETEVVEATETEKAYTKYTCKVCGDSYTEEIAEEPKEEEQTEAAAAIQARIDYLVDLFGITTDMSDEDVYMAIVTKADNDTMGFVLSELPALEQDAAVLTEEEFDTLQKLDELSHFINVLDMMMNPSFAGSVHVLDEKVKITDSANSISVKNGTVTATAKGSLISKKTNTITVTNNSGAKAQVSFDYTASSANSFKIADTSVATSGNYSVLLEAGGTLSITLQSKSGFSGTTATLTLSNFACISVQESSKVTFNFDDRYGSITVAGETVKSGDVKDINGTDGAALVATAVSGAKFLGWVGEDGSIISTNASHTLIPAKDMPIKAVFVGEGSAPYFSVGSAAQKSESVGLLGISKRYYYEVGATHIIEGLNEAAQCALDSTGKTLVLLNDATLPAGDYTIPGGVTLLIPFDNANTMYTTEAVSVEESKFTTPTAYRTLTLADGAKLIINGAMSLSAKHRVTQGSKTDGGSPRGPVSFVKMEGNSSITVNNGGALYAYGYITGSGSVTAKSGATVYENFQIMDFRGGDQSTQMKNGVFPITQYYIQNIEVPLTIYSGATEYAYTSVAMQKSTFGSAVAFISNSGAMFNLTGGSVIKDYDEGRDRLLINSNGNFTVNPINMELGMSSINSKDYDLGINSNMTINVNSGSITLNQDVALLPGAEINIANGATCTLGTGNSIYVYDADEWGNYVGVSNKKLVPITYAPGKSYTRTEADLVDASICVNGTVNASKGYAYTTAGGANIYTDGTGVAIINPGTQTVTYQVTQASDPANSAYTEIPLTSAKLKNADGSYTETTTAGTYERINGVWHIHVYEEAVTDPTCTEKGYTTYTCDCGDSYVGNYVDAKGHTAGADATCTEAQTCTVCGVELKAALGHSYESVVTAPTCTEKGFTTHTCACGDSYIDSYVDANGHSYNPVVTEPTCTEKGFTTHTCACGDSYVDSYVDANGHSYNPVVTDPTCTDKGFTTYTCSVCGDSYVDDEVAAKGHTAGAEATCTDDQICTVCKVVLVEAKGHSHKEVVTKPTCTEKGFTTHTCVCGDSYVDSYVDAKGHSYDAVVTAPTCTAQGFTTYTCSVCDDSYVADYTNNLGHSYDDGVITKDPSEVGGGEKTFTCQTCGDFYTVPLNHEHKFSEVVTDPTCTAEGYTTYTCKCGHSYIYDYVVANGHTAGADATCTKAQTCTVCGAELKAALGHKYTKVVTDPTCTEKGFTTYTCTVCDDEYVGDEVAANGHSYNPVVTAPTCTDKGFTTYTCTVCDDEYVGDEVAAKGHSYNPVVTAPTCTEKGFTTYTCSVCGDSYVADEVKENGHSYNPVVTDPTCTDKGFTTYTCSVCGDSYVDDEVAAKGHTAGADATCTEAQTCTVCGTELVAAKGHTAVVDEAVAATCTTTGLTEGEHCGICGTVTVAQEVVPVIDHELKFEEEFPVTCTTDGHSEGYYCLNCDYVTWTVVASVGHQFEDVAAKNPTYNSVGWEAHRKCAVCPVKENYVEIPVLPEPSIRTYDDLLTNLALLEEMASVYVKENPGKDPLALVIKYIRTGVDRYNSGSWGIMAGYEDTDFAKFVSQQEDALNATAESVDQMVHVTGLKNLYNITLPSGEITDIGHMFGTMDISYHNNGSINHADVAGWTGDLVDLLEFSDKGGVSGTLDEMIAEIRSNYLFKDPEILGAPSFNITDLYGDLDGLYLIQMINTKGYSYDYEDETSGLVGMLREYFTTNLDMVKRADFFLRNRLDGVSTRNAIREAVYMAYTGNKLISTLEGTREFTTDNLTDLRKAVCYAYADYMCELAGDYVAAPEKSYYDIFSSQTTQLAPGIVQDIKLAHSYDGKQMAYYLVTADITRNDVDVFANYNANDPSQGWAMSTVLDQANAAQERRGNPESELYIPNYNVIAATNGAGFDMGTGEPGGLLVMDGVEYHAVNNHGFFGILKDGTPVIGTTAEYNSTYKGQVRDGIAGFGAVLIKDGKIVASEASNRASRTAVGITKTGKVVLMVLDGRQEPWSCGGDMAEIAQIMLEAGCVNAVNLDGGGSTTFVAKQPGEEALEVVNRPSDGVQRSVSTSLIVVSTAPSSTAFDHAILEAEADHLTVNTSIQLTAKGVSATGNAVELPEGATWAVSDAAWATITEDGLFTGLRSGSVEARLMLDDQIIGTKTMTIVTPDTVYFTKASVDTVYGATIALPVKALYEGKTVAVNENDLVFTMSNTKAGEMNGFSFVANSNENSGIKNVTITAALAVDPDVKGSVVVNLYKQGEMSFDFDQATGGDRTLAWYRTVTNATTDDNSIYEVVDIQKDMVTNYTLAIDMTEIPIPERLSDLTYMLPGANLEDASAWGFLMQLAQRISSLTEITASVKFDKNFDVNVDEMKLVNDFFKLTNVDVNEETNTITLTLNWIKQSQAIDPESANPLCIVSGIKLTPKADADWGSKNKLEAVHVGDISYKVCMRANALYSFAQKPENQETFGLFAYANPNDVEDKGGYFEDTYANFTDSYTLVNEVKEGWVNEDGGYAYYQNGNRLTGIQSVDGYYYDFGENGVNPGQTKYSGLIVKDGKTYYALLGELASGWQAIGGDYYYFSTSSFAAYTGVKTVGGRTYTFDENGILVRGDFVETAKGTQYYWAGRALVSRWITLEEGIYRADHNGYICYGNYPVIEAGREACTWWEFDEVTGLRGDICDGFIQREGITYYCENGLTTYGVVETENGLIFCGTYGLVTTNKSCYVSESLDSTCGLETGNYWCDANGYIQKDGFATISGNTYYFSDYVRAKGFTKIGDDYYLFNAGSGVMQCDKLLWVGANNYGISTGYYTFQADGTMYVPDPNGPRAIIEEDGKLYFTIDGVKQTNGLNELDGEYYYANTNGTLAVNTTIWISAFNNLIEPGNGYFSFDTEGKLIKTGFVKGSNGYTYYYDDLVRVKGFTKLGDDYYFFNAGNGTMQCDKVLWVGANNYGISTGYYTFQADGTMYIPDPNGPRAIVEEGGKLYFTIDGVKQTNGLNELNGEYYYANSNGTLAVDTVVYMSKFNDLIAPGNGYFGFDTEGKLIKTGFVTGGGYTYYYNDLVRVKGFTKLDDDYYFFNAGSGAMQCDKLLWVGSNSYGLTAGYYTFQADGTMYVPDPNGPKAIVEKNGKLYFTVDGVNQTNGLNELNGEYYYANTNGTLAVNTVVYISNFNDLIAPGSGYFGFDTEGKLIKTGFVKGSNGYTYYYDDLIRVKGFTKLGDDYYFFNAGSGAMQCDKNLWVSGSNPYGIKGGTYTFGADGKMVQ